MPTSSARPLPLRLALLALVPLAIAGCNPLACWYPPELPSGEPAFEFTSSDGVYPIEPVEVVIDDEGVPHIYGDSWEDLSYALGFMHAKDRQFQMLSFKLALFGRLAEMLGEGSLGSDQSARLITYRVDEQLESLSPRDEKLYAAYAAGANDGAAWAGPSVEMTFLGAQWEPWEARDVLAITRFFAWDLSSIGMYSELARMRIANRIAEDDPVYEELMTSTWTGGTPVVRGQEHSGERGFESPWQDGAELPPAPRPAVPKTRLARRLKKDHPSAKPARRAEGAINPLAGVFRLLSDEGGASNVWAVHGSETSTGAPAHAHDPHLAHRLPGLFYLAHLETPAFTAAGGTVPGAPGVLLGHGRHVSWGTPVSNADTMDLVRIEPSDDGETYLLDGEQVPFEELTQTYKLGFEDNAETVTETWLITEFGPVLPPAFQHLHDEGEMYALMWPGHRPIEGSGAIVSSLWELAASEDVEQATEAIQKLTSPPITMGMAFDDGTIAYRISGDIPVRKSAEPPWLPRDGTSRDAQWAGRLPPEYKPQLENPARGYYVAANQRIVGEGGPAWEIVGIEGAHPFRAMRITERLDELLTEGEPSPEDVFAIQQDVESVYARELAPVYGERCPDALDGHGDDVVDAFCDQIRDFDGRYTVDATGAIPFDRLDQALRLEVLGAHLGEEVAFQLRRRSFIETNLYRALLRARDGEEPALFDDPETDDYDGLEVFVARAAKRALDILVEQIGADVSSWRWGDHHYRQLSSNLASLPLVGGALQSERFEESGCRYCVRSERIGEVETSPEGPSDEPPGLVRSGAVLRIHSDMSDPPVVCVVNDTGQSGHFGHWSFDIAYDRWTRGDPAQLAVGKESAGEQATGRVRFLRPEQ